MTMKAKRRPHLTTTVSVLVLGLTTTTTLHTVTGAIGGAWGRTALFNVMAVSRLSRKPALSSSSSKSPSTSSPLVECTSSSSSSSSSAAVAAAASKEAIKEKGETYGAYHDHDDHPFEKKSAGGMPRTLRAQPIRVEREVEAVELVVRTRKRIRVRRRPNGKMPDGFNRPKPTDLRSSSPLDTKKEDEHDWCESDVSAPGVPRGGADGVGSGGGDREGGGGSRGRSGQGQNSWKEEAKKVPEVFSYVCSRVRLLLSADDVEEENDCDSSDLGDEVANASPKERESPRSKGGVVFFGNGRGRRSNGGGSGGAGRIGNGGYEALEVSRMGALHGRFARDPTMLKDGHLHHSREYIWQAATSQEDGFDYDNDIDGDDVEDDVRGDDDDDDDDDDDVSRKDRDRHRHHQRSHPDMPDSQVYASHAMAYRYVAHEDIDSLRLPKDILGFWLGDRHRPNVHALWSSCSPVPSVNTTSTVNAVMDVKQAEAAKAQTWRVGRLVQRVKTLTADVVQMALSEEDILNDWDKTPDGCLAKIIVLGEIAPMVKQGETRFCQTVRQYRARQLAKRARRQYAEKYTPVEMFWVLRPLMANGAARIERRQGAAALRSMLRELNTLRVMKKREELGLNSGGEGGGEGRGGGDEAKWLRVAAGQAKKGKADKKWGHKNHKNGKGNGGHGGGRRAFEDDDEEEEYIVADGDLEVDGMILTKDMAEFMQQYLVDVEGTFKRPPQ